MHAWSLFSLLWSLQGREGVACCALGSGTFPSLLLDLVLGVKARAAGMLGRPLPKSTPLVYIVSLLSGKSICPAVWDTLTHTSTSNEMNFRMHNTQGTQLLRLN